MYTHKEKENLHIIFPYQILGHCGILKMYILMMCDMCDVIYYFA